MIRFFFLNANLGIRSCSAAAAQAVAATVEEAAGAADAAAAGGQQEEDQDDGGQDDPPAQLAGAQQGVAWKEGHYERPLDGLHVPDVDRGRFFLDISRSAYSVAAFIQLVSIPQELD